MLSRSQRHHMLSPRVKIPYFWPWSEGLRLPAHQHVPSTHQSHSLPPIQRRSLGAGGNALAKLQNCKVKENIVKTSREKKQVAKKNRIKPAADLSFLFEAIVVPCPPGSGDRGSPI